LIERDPEDTAQRRIRTRVAARELRSRRTETEKRFWDRLRLYKIDGLQFRQQHPIGPYIVDFCCHRVRLVIEIDGAIHEQQREYDAERDEYLAARGYRVVRFSADRVIHDLDNVLVEIRAACSPSPAHGGGGWGVGAPLRSG
jgi:very-short-patch-repair endonuclease